MILTIQKIKEIRFYEIGNIKGNEFSCIEISSTPETQIQAGQIWIHNDTLDPSWKMFSDNSSLEILEAVDSESIICKRKYSCTTFDSLGNPYVVQKTDTIDITISRLIEFYYLKTPPQKEDEAVSQARILSDLAFKLRKEESLIKSGRFRDSFKSLEYESDEIRRGLAYLENLFILEGLDVQINPHTVMSEGKHEASLGVKQVTQENEEFQKLFEKLSTYKNKKEVLSLLSGLSKKYTTGTFGYKYGEGINRNTFELPEYIQVKILEPKFLLEVFEYCPNDVMCISFLRYYFELETINWVNVNRKELISDTLFNQSYILFLSKIFGDELFTAVRLTEQLIKLKNDKIYDFNSSEELKDFFDWIKLYPLFNGAIKLKLPINSRESKYFMDKYVSIFKNRI